MSGLMDFRHCEPSQKAWQSSVINQVYSKNYIFLFTLFFIIAGCTTTSTYQLPEMPTKQGYVKIDDGQLFYQIIGKGDPIIVIHGGPGLDQGYLLPGMASLAKNHQVVFYDQRGSGRSTSSLDEKRINIEQFVEDIESLRKSLKLSKITLISHSWGGMLAMRYAIKYGSNLNKLVLMNTLPATTAGIHDFVEEVERKIEPSVEEMEKIQSSQAFLDGDPQTISQYYSLFFKHYLYNPNDLEKLNTQLDPQGAATGVNVSKILEKAIFTQFIDLTDDLRKLKIPTLILHGENDVLPLSTAQEIADAIKGSQLVVQKQCGHFAYVEKPQEWLDLMEGFLRG